jgi:outer membrane protein W
MKRFVVLSLFLVLVGAVSAEAEIRAGLIGAFALTPDGDYGNGPTFGASLGVGLTKNLEVELSVLRSQFPASGTATGLTKGQVATLPIELRLLYRFAMEGSHYVPYVAAGAGYSPTSFSVDSGAVGGWNAVNFDLSENVKGGLCASAAAGLEITISPTFVLALEARYDLVRSSGSWQMTDRESGVAVSGSLSSLKLDTLLLGVGLRFSF